MKQLIEMIVELLRQISAGLQEVWIFGILPLYLFLYALIGVITLRRTGNNEFAREIRSFRRKPATELIRKGIQKFLRIAFYITLFLVLMPLFVVLNLRYESVLSVIASDIYSLCSLSIGLTTIVLTVSVVIVLFHKNYYLVFSINDVLKSYHFTECMGLLLTGCLGTCFCAFAGTYAGGGFIWKVLLSLFAWCLLMCLVFCGIAFVIIYKVMFSNKKIELRLLNRLYAVFLSEADPSLTQQRDLKECDFEAVRTNVEYLCAEYLTAARTVPVHRIESFRCLCGDTSKRTLDEQFKRSTKTFMLNAIALWCISMTVIAAVLGDEGTGLLIIDTAALAVESISALILYKRKKVPGHYEESSSDYAGYEIELKDRTVLVKNIKLSHSNRFDRFVRSMNSLSAFFYITIGRGMDADLTNRALTVVIDWISDVKEKHSSIYLPIFAAGYFAFSLGEEVCCVRECYREILSSKSNMMPESPTVSRFLEFSDKDAQETVSGTESFDEMLVQYLQSLSSGNYTGDERFKGRYDEYLEWLKG